MLSTKTFRLILVLGFLPIVERSLWLCAVRCDSHRSRKWQTSASPRKRTILSIRQRERLNMPSVCAYAR